ncbi:xanthine dehydrogenase [Bacillus sp. SAJ1]|nr:xanthine dehydrogenase [Bacillus sp. SAJ1]
MADQEWSTIMIPFNFEYMKVYTIQEAVSLYQHFLLSGKTPMYFGGGTEIITLGRTSSLFTDAVIDINGIPECNILLEREQKLILGSCISLTQSVYQDSFPLLSKTAIEIADQTARNKISLGGNICSNIRFKEGILPFLITDSNVVIANEGGIREIPIKDAFNEEYQLPAGTLLVQLLVDEEYINAPYYAKKIRTIGTVGYPVISINAIKINGRLKIAVSGISLLPIHEETIDNRLNNRQLAYKDRIKEAIDAWPKPIIDDIQGSADYKKYLLEKNLLEIFQKLEVE